MAVSERLICKVKTAMRVTTSAFDDDEIEPMIEAAQLDLEGAGVDLNESMLLAEQAVVFYCKGVFGLEANEKWMALYEKTRNALASRTSGGKQ